MRTRVSKRRMFPENRLGVDGPIGFVDDCIGCSCDDPGLEEMDAGGDAGKRAKDKVAIAQRYCNATFSFSCHKLAASKMPPLPLQSRNETAVEETTLDDALRYCSMKRPQQIANLPMHLSKSRAALPSKVTFLSLWRVIYLL
ncbi:uncharacterized protein UTRI_00093 [Ustilago trichophora]|uniref:Uncharacterized protein n=1 Tax=Ustilago trichophora TaxID=86804 RepID=A0A5C3DT94_9BASI|nr:uncharacterized protein UTRI_00093 [Ustilago trichophora]